MAFAAGALSKVSVSDTKASLLSAPATGAAGTVTYQWYRSTLSGFTPGVGNILTGKTSLALDDSGLIPGTQYYYEVVATDSVGPATANSAQLSVLTLNQQLAQNQFAMSEFLGVLDLRFNPNTVSVQIDDSQVGDLIGGQAVKIVDVADGVPKVIGCSANSDGCIGFLNFSQKDRKFSAGDFAEMSMDGNCMYLWATGPISRYGRVQLDVSTKGGVAALVGSSGASIVGYAYDKASAGGQLIRIMIKAPTFLVA